MSAITVGRIPLFLFAAVQASYLHRRDTLGLIGWLAGPVTTVAALWLPLPLTNRVGVALSVGAGVSAAVYGYVLANTVRLWAGEHP